MVVPSGSSDVPLMSPSTTPTGWFPGGSLGLLNPVSVWPRLVAPFYCTGSTGAFWPPYRLPTSLAARTWAEGLFSDRRWPSYRLVVEGDACLAKS